MEIREPFPASDFDEWAGTYDQDVLDEGQFPFTGYQRALETVIRLANVQPGMSVLDLGTGTGNLAALFVELGCRVWATDFSEVMLKQARLKMPEVSFFRADLRQGLPSELPGSFDRIVSAYVFHHFELPEKTNLVQVLVRRLNPGGKLVIADIAFNSCAALKDVKRAVGEAWEEEFYWLADETLLALEHAGVVASFIQVSSMAGVFVIQNGCSRESIFCQAANSNSI